MKTKILILSMMLLFAVSNAWSQTTIATLKVGNTSGAFFTATYTSLLGGYIYAETANGQKRDVTSGVAFSIGVAGNDFTVTLKAQGLVSLTEFSSETQGNLVSLDFSGCTTLKKLHCRNNFLSTLNLKGCTALTEVKADNQTLQINPRAYNDDFLYRNLITYTNPSGVVSITIDGREYNSYDAALKYYQASSDNKLLFTSPKIGGSTSTPFSGVITLNNYRRVISISLPATLSIKVGSGTSTLTRTINPANATSKMVEYVSDNPSVARVSVNSSTNPIVTPVSVGTAKITGTSLDGAKTATCVVTVTANTAQPPLEIQPASIEIIPKPLALTVGGSAILSSTILPSNATSTSVTWKTDKATVATISEPDDLSTLPFKNNVSHKKITAVSPGTATITVSTSNGKTATCVVTVTAASPTTVAVTGVEVTTPSPLALTVGGSSVSLQASVKPANATNKNITWKSNNEAIAYVSSAGAVVGLSAGTTIITATTAEGSFTDFCTVNVTDPGVSNDNIGSSPFAVFPNPTSGTVNITGLTPGKTVNIYSATGALVGSYFAQGEEITINLGNISNGLYFINFEGKTVKIVKN